MTPVSIPHSIAAPRAQGRLGRAATWFFSSWSNSLGTLATLGLGGWLGWNLYLWAVRNAVFVGTAADCRAARGACWAFIATKLEFAVFGLYPLEERWRAVLALALLAALVGISLVRRFWSARLVGAWALIIALVYLVLAGGALGLAPVPLRLWSGMVVTAWLSVVGLIAAYPLGLILALGRRSDMPVVRWFSIGWIEVVRGVPLVSILIMASVVLPLFLPEGLEIANLMRAQVAFILFGSAYLAEVFRGGLQAVPQGQYEGATALGLGYWQTLRLVVLPQALKLVIPAQVNTFIAIFKDTSLILVIGVFDFLGTIKAMLSDPAWLGFSTEAYVFAAAVYFLMSWGMSRYSRHLERELNPERAGRS